MKDLDRALEGIDRKEILDALTPLYELARSKPEMEATFWSTRKTLLAQYGIEDPLETPDGVSLSQMPLFLAYAWKQYVDEAHPRVKLHLMLEFVELAVRFLVAVQISILRSMNGDVLPEVVATELAELIRKPTLGQWLHMMRELSAHKPDGALLPGVFSLYGELGSDEWLSNKGEPAVS
ncbi:hypothetical protein D6779_09300, partial [Candidatus Parcubacteria bacterium]